LWLWLWRLRLRLWQLWRNNVGEVKGKRHCGREWGQAVADVGLSRSHVEAAAAAAAAAVVADAVTTSNIPIIGVGADGRTTQ
jgi:hypothetical protein